MATTGTTFVATLVLAGVLVIAACSAGQAERESLAHFDSPSTAAVSWFAAVNHKDRAASLAHFTPGSAAIGDWGTGPSTWPTFSSVQCKDESEPTARGDEARVRCSFHESDAASAGQPSSWWDVYLHREADGRWLITSYGQG